VTGLSDDGGRLHIAVHTAGNRTTLTLTGELDQYSGPQLAQLLDMAMDGSVEHVDVQMAQVGFVDVDGVRELVRAYRLGAGRGVKLTLRDPQPDIVWLLRITGAALLLGGSTAPPPPVEAGEPLEDTPSVPLAGIASERDQRANERDRRADEREEHADDRDLLAQERDRVVDEREQRVSDHQRWEDIREDMADARERDLERRESER